MKNILIITQKVDLQDDVLGFFYEWIVEFAKQWNKVTVICLWEGTHALPANVRIFSLGKEKKFGRMKYLANFYRYIVGERNMYDAVFVHMNPMYVLLGFPVWKILKKTISLWYAHGYVPLTLRIADVLTDFAFTSTPEGYRIDSKKIRIVGQGIAVEKFRPGTNQSSGPFHIVSVGRVSPSKDYQTLLNAVTLLRSSLLQVTIAGGPARESDAIYLERLKDEIVKKKLSSTVSFAGPIPNKNIVPLLQSADLFVNMGHTGSLDKAVLEAMACGLPVLTCNEAYDAIFGKDRDLFTYPKKDYQTLAQKIEYFIGLDPEERRRMGYHLRTTVVQDHNLQDLIRKITSVLNSHDA